MSRSRSPGVNNVALTGSANAAVWSIVARQRGAFEDLPIAVPDVDPTAIRLEIVAEDLMAVAKDPDAGRVAEVIAVHEAIVAVTQRQLGAG
jgi:hypothetical protein